MKTNGKKNALVMCECAIMIALAAVLSFVKILELSLRRQCYRIQHCSDCNYLISPRCKMGIAFGICIQHYSAYSNCVNSFIRNIIFGSCNNHFLGLYIRIHGYWSCRLSQKQGQQSVCRCRNRHGRSLCFKIYLSCNFGLYRMGRCFNPLNRRTSLFTQLQRYIYDSRNNNQCGGCILAFRLS